jgi:hypothetical protein
MGSRSRDLGFEIRDSGLGIWGNYLQVKICKGVSGANHSVEFERSPAKIRGGRHRICTTYGPKVNRKLSFDGRFSNSTEWTHGRGRTWFL